MSRPIARCVACLGSGKVLPECAPWNTFGGPCPVCAGNGYPNTVRLKTLCVGDIWQDINGNEFLISAKDKDGCRIVHQSGSRANTEEYAPHNPPVRVIRRADVSFSISTCANQTWECPKGHGGNDFANPNCARCASVVSP